MENAKKNVAVLASCQALLTGTLGAEICSLALQLLDMPSSAGDDRRALARPLAKIIAQPRNRFLSVP